MRTVIGLVAAAVSAYLALCAWVFLGQRSQIYFPTPAVELPGVDALWIESQGERIKAWAVRRPGPRALLYFGGNAEDVAGDVELLADAFPDRSLYLVNYRGYGGSSGRPTESGLHADALAVFDRIHSEHPDVAVMGRSLGSGVAMHLAAERPVSRLVLVTPFDSLVNVARAHFRWLPVGLLLRDRYESVRSVDRVRAPVLIVIAADDEIIPRASSDALVHAFPEGQVRAVVVEAVDHNTLDLSPQYLDSVRAFLAGA